MLWCYLANCDLRLSLDQMGHFHAFSLTLDIALNWRPDGELIIGEHWKIFTDFALLCTFSQMGHWSKACDIGFVDLQVSKHGIYQQPPPTLRSSPGEGLGIFDFWRFSGSYLISLHSYIYFWADAHRRLRRITWPDVIAGWAWKLLNEDLLLQKYIPYVFLNIFMDV